MSIRYFIDGHNLIWSNKHLSSIGENDLQGVHQILVNAVASYLKKKKNIFATICFDNRFSDEIQKETCDGVEVIFCPKLKKGKGADDVLTKCIEEYTDEEKFVVTTDKELQHRCKIRGGKIFSMEKFLELIKIQK